MSTRKPDWLHHDTSQEGVFRLVPGWSFLKERKVFHICNQINWIICISNVNLFRWSTFTATWSTWSATTTRCWRASTSSSSTSPTTGSPSSSPRYLWWVTKFSENEQNCWNWHYLHSAAVVVWSRLQSQSANCEGIPLDFASLQLFCVHNRWHAMIGGL